MQNYVQPGAALTLTAPAGGVVSGGFYQIGQLIVCAADTADENAPFTGMTVGVFDAPKASGEAWTVGACVYWDDTDKEFTTTAAGNMLAGCAVEAAVSAATSGRLRLNGVSRPNEAS